jgi:hypothetical protein
LHYLTDSKYDARMSTAVIYARVPQTLKEAAELYASDHALTLTAAVADLLGRGLAALSDEHSLAELQTRVGELASEKAQTEAELQAAKTELRTLAALGQRSRQIVGTCPNADCGKPITGIDLLATGRCPVCGHGLSDLLAGSQRSAGLNQQEFLLLIGALGALLGVALLAAKNQ